MTATTGLRVCMMNDNFGRSSGAAIAIRRIASSLPEMEVFTAGCGDGPLEEDLSWVGEGRHAQFDLKTRRPLHLLQELLRLRRWLREQGCQLVHCHHRRLAVLARTAGVPVLYTAQLAFPREAWFRWLHPGLMTSITPSVAANLLETTNCRVLACISNPTPFPASAPPIDLQAVSRRAVCIARLAPVKGHVHLLNAWKMLADRGLRYELDLVGEGPLEAALKAQAERLGIADLVHFRGFTRDVSSYLAQSLFAVLVSEVEGQGIVTLEAAAMGRASLLTDVPGSHDLLLPQRVLPNGLRFGDERQLADALEAWFSNPATAALEGQLSFDFLRQASDPGAIADQYRSVYRKILGIEQHRASLG